MGTDVQRVIIDRAVSTGGFDSYADLARRLNVTTATLSQWRTGTTKLPERRLAQLCEITGDEPAIWAMALMAEETNIVSLRTSIQKALLGMGVKNPAALVGRVGFEPTTSGLKVRCSTD